jgi:hypothetical protein
MRPDQVAPWLSEARFDAYLEASGRDHARAVALYNWNAEISAAVMEVLYHLEVILRNAIDQCFPATDIKRPISIAVPDVWLCDAAILTEESRERVNDAIARLTQEGKRPTRGRVVASLTFGFWRALFVSRYEDLWRSRLVQAFPGGTGRRREVNQLVNSILHLRNRVAHHEAIFALDLQKKHHQLLGLAALIDPAARQYISSLSRVDKLLLEKP